MRSLSICLIALAVVVLAAQPAMALPVMRIPYFSAGPVWALNPSQIASLVIVEANTSHLAAADSEALAISFVPTATAGAPGGFAIAPAIAQTSSRTLACDRSYFFQDFTVP